MRNSLAPYELAKEEMKKNIIEVPGLAKNNPRIIWYHSFTTLKATNDETPWCSAFMCACAELNGYKSTRSAAAKSWLNYGEPVEKRDAMVGDIVIFSRSGGHHVAFLHSPYKEGDKDVLVLGGNQSNSVRVSKYPAEKILAFRRFPA